MANSVGYSVFLGSIANRVRGFKVVLKMIQPFETPWLRAINSLGKKRFNFLKTPFS